MKREIFHTDDAPAAIGPYSQAVGFGNLVFAAGQAGLDPKTGKLVPGGVEAQAEQVMQNLEAVLLAAGTSLHKTLKATIFLRYMKDFAAVNAVYARYIGDVKPARSTVAVSALPMAALVEIEVIAILPEAPEPEVQATPPAVKKPKNGSKKIKTSSLNCCTQTRS